jgi:hypothetical protein
VSAARTGLYAFIGTRLAWKKIPAIVDLLADLPASVLAPDSRLPEALLGSEIMALDGRGGREVLTHYGLAHIANTPIARMTQREHMNLQIVRALERAPGAILFDGTFEPRLWSLRRRTDFLAIAISEQDVAQADHKQILPPKRALLQLDTAQPEALRAALVAANLPASSTHASVWVPISDATTAARAQTVIASSGVPVSLLRTVATDP